MNTVEMRRVKDDDIPVLEKIRMAAFAPIFASFRKILGDSLYDIVQAHEDNAQSEFLVFLSASELPWELYVAEIAGETVGFVALKLDRERLVGEIGLNAVHPDQAGRGIATAMYRFALSRMKAAGMSAATVSTGADENHAPARRAYQKVGFEKRIPIVWMCREL